MDADLARVIEARGFDIDLAHKRPLFRFAGCPGVVSFSHLLVGWPTTIDHLTDQEKDRGRPSTRGGQSSSL